MMQKVVDTDGHGDTLVERVIACHRYVVRVLL
jgi:hypothetical protein